eukprot:m.114195 g.114195  ORF g.114195 m.114195 type:complete len:73 (+) comp12814_c0_seq1:56-274(+)
MRINKWPCLIDTVHMNELTVWELNIKVHVCENQFFFVLQKQHAPHHACDSLLLVIVFAVCNENRLIDVKARP